MHKIAPEFGRCRTLLFFLPILLFYGCGTVAPNVAPKDTEILKNETSLFWPPPPAEPRIFFVRNISGYKDFEIKRSFWRKVKDFVAGRMEFKVSRPMAVAVGDDGTLCFTNTDIGAIYVYQPLEKRLDRITQVDRKINFISPVGIGAGSDGIIYIADSGLRKVFAINNKGAARFVLGQEDGILRPTGVFAGGHKLYVVDTESSKVFVFDEQGKPLLEFGRRGDGDGEFNFPTHIYADNTGKMYVSDTINARIQIFDAQGKFLNSIGKAGDGSGHFSRPKGVVVDSYGHIYVADALFDNIQIFDDENNFLMNFGEAGNSDGEFWLPAGLAIDKNNYLYVADSYNHRISVFHYTGGQ